MDEKKKKPRAEVVSPQSLERLSPPALTAKKDFTLHHNDYQRDIKAGDDVSDIPEHYHVNLRTEGVL